MSAHATIMQMLAFPAQGTVHGENVTVWDSGGTAHVLVGVVHRGELMAEFGPQPTMPSYDVTVELSEAELVALGITTGDRPNFPLALRKKATDTTDSTFRIAQVLDRDGGILHLALQG